MTERESAINRDLRALDDAHRLGRISRTDYRGRRRRVLQSLGEGGAVTARKTLMPAGATTRPHPERASATADATAAGRAHVSLLSMRPGLAWKPLAIVAGVLLVVAIVWALLRH